MQRIVIGCVVAAIAVLAIWHPAPRPPHTVPPSPVASARPHPHKAVRATVMVVYVAGEVARPGLYRMHPGERVADAVRLAGGLLASADPLAVNLAARLNDGDGVAVPKPGVRTAHRATRAFRSKAVLAPESPIDLNAADAQALARIPGIGTILARRIVAMRDQDGPFTSLDELLDVAGMTPARLERAGQYLIL